MKRPELIQYCLSDGQLEIDPEGYLCNYNYALALERENEELREALQSMIRRSQSVTSRQRLHYAVQEGYAKAGGFIGKLYEAQCDAESLLARLEERER